jgi:hypothetical protein
MLLRLKWSWRGAGLPSGALSSCYSRNAFLPGKKTKKSLCG